MNKAINKPSEFLVLSIKIPPKQKELSVSTSPKSFRRNEPNN